MTTREPFPTLPGRCIPVPQIRTEVRDRHGKVDWVVETHLVEGIDLDGHGSAVWLVPPGRRDMNVGTMWWRLFIKRGDCGHEMGIVVGMNDPIALQVMSCGLFSFRMVESVVSEVGSEMGSVASTTYSYNGIRYVGGGASP